MIAKKWLTTNSFKSFIPSNIGDILQRNPDLFTSFASGFHCQLQRASLYFQLAVERKVHYVRFMKFAVLFEPAIVLVTGCYKARRE